MSSQASNAFPGALTSGGVRTILSAPHVTPNDLADGDVRLAFLGFPFEGGNVAIERPGSSGGPHGLRVATSSVATPWSFEWDINLFDAYNLVDCGDSAIIAGDLLRTHRSVEEDIHTILAGGAIPVTIGGSHSLAIPGARALSRHLGPDRRMGYMQIDAHMDGADDVDGVSETNAGTMLRVFERDNVDGSNMAFIGLRGSLNTRDWFDAARERDIGIYPMSDVRRRGFDEVVSEALDRVWDGVDGVYVSFDTDSIDSAWVPGTTSPEPAGFSATEILEVARRVGERGLTAVDNVELAPIYDPSGITATIVWNVISEMLFAHAKHHL